MKKIFSTLFALGLMLIANAQTITFDTDDYKAVSTYDSWTESPFRTGQLQGNAAVVSNHLNQVNEVLGYAPDSTKNILGFQRSRYGSNLYGVRIDLKEPFRLTKNYRFLHVMVNKPIKSRMMVIGLGKRTEQEWSWQNGEAEQFWALSSGAVGGEKDTWQDAVFSFKGFSYAEGEGDGIDIYSLVIVPDVQSGTLYTEDWACYFDQIEINSSSEIRFYSDKYATSFDKNMSPTRTDRGINAVGIKGGTDGEQTYTVDKSKVYYAPTAATLSAKPGDKLTPVYNYTGTWMSGYTYIDFANDGNFSYATESNGKPSAGSDIVSYSAYQVGSTWQKSDGTTASNGNTIVSAMPSFTLPANINLGYYRMRFKVDWNNIEPVGNASPDNLIYSNGGGIVDVLLDVHGDYVKVSDQQLNGAILTADSVELNNYQAPYGKDFTIRMSPAPGFTYSGIRVRHGYNCDGDSLINDNAQYFDTYYKASDFDRKDQLTIPAALMTGSTIIIEGYFTELKSSEDYKTLINKAQEALSNEGVGFPKADSEERKNLQTLVGSTSISLNALADAIDAFKASTDVELPLSGKTYTFTQIARDGHKAYLNTTSKDLQYVDVIDTITIPESAYFLCTATTEGLTFTTADGRFLTTKGLSANPTTLEVAKLVLDETNSHIDVTDAIDLFGLVTIDGNKGYERANSVDGCKPAFLFAKESDKPYFEWNNSSAFIVREVINNEGPVEPAPVIIKRPVKPLVLITSLNQLGNSRAYIIKNINGEGTLVYNPDITETYLSIRQVTNSSYNGLPSNATVKAAYQDSADIADLNNNWQILSDENNNWYLYNPGNQKYVTNEGRNYKFTATRSMLKQLRDNGDGTFGFNTNDTNTSSTYFACIVTNEAEMAVRNWTYSDHGSIFYIYENPNVTVDDPLGLDALLPAIADEVAQPDQIYDLQGRQIATEPQKGVFIRKGKKKVK